MYSTGTVYTCRGSIVLELCKLKPVLLCLEIALYIGPEIRQQMSFFKWQKLNGQEGSQKYCSSVHLSAIQYF
jgi:hypothetical protein